MDKYEILVAGIGGQGVLFIGSLLDRAARINGFETVIGSEIHGMAQRGGPLVSYTRLGNDVHGPIISPGSADVMISLELVEGLRNIERLAKNGWLIVAETKLPSGAMWVAGIEYPTKEDVLGAMREATDRITVFDAQRIAKEIGHINAANVVLLGVAMATVDDFPITTDSMKEAIKVVLPPRLVDINLKAFEEGTRAAKVA